MNFNNRLALEQNNSGTRRTGQQGRCIDLNGTNQAVRVADNTDLDITDNLTVSVWAKNSNSSLSVENQLIGKWDSSANKREWLMGVIIGDVLQIAIGSDSGATGNVWRSNSALTGLNTNNLFTFTFSGGVLKVYLNGVAILGSVVIGSLPATLVNNTADLTVGARLGSD